jgi:hypothetical protein
LQVEYERDGFKWDEHQQSQVLGSFYWLHWATQLPGGILASKYGTKFIFVASNGIACVMCMFMPILSYLDYRLMIGLRLVQGIVAGFAWPCKESRKFLKLSIEILQYPSNQQFDGSMDPTQRAQQVRFFLSRQLIWRRHRLSPLRLHHQSELLGVGFPLLRNLRNDLVGSVAVFRELNEFSLTFRFSNPFQGLRIT